MQKCCMCRHSRRNMKGNVYCKLFGIIIREDYGLCKSYDGIVHLVKSGATASAGTGGVPVSAGVDMARPALLA